jgi:hypothetical protein
MLYLGVVCPKASHSMEQKPVPIDDARYTLTDSVSEDERERVKVWHGWISILN